MKEFIFETTGSDKIAMIKYAIINKYSIHFHYNGVKVADPNIPEYTKKGQRWVMPVALGRSAGSGKMMLRAWQSKGTTNTEKPGWKTFLIDEISGNVNVWDGNDSGWAPFEVPPFPQDQQFNQRGDEKMGGGSPSGFSDGKVVTNKMVADNSLADPIIASGKTLVMNIKQPGGPNLALVTQPTEPGVDQDPTDTVNVEPDTEVTPIEKKMGIKTKVKAAPIKMSAKPIPVKKVSKEVPKVTKLVSKTKGENPKIDDPNNDIEASIINTKNGNPNNQKQKLPPEQSAAPEQEPGLEEPLKESSGWLQWLAKII